MDIFVDRRCANSENLANKQEKEANERLQKILEL
jgi:hypothetical protein